MHYKKERKKETDQWAKENANKVWKKLKNVCDNRENAKTQPPSSMFFCFKCFADLSIPLASNQQVDFEEEESINYLEQKCVSYGFYKYYQIQFENWLAICSMQVVL